MFTQQGELSLALEHYERSLAIRRQSGDRQGEGVTLNNIGAVLYYKGDLEGARRHYQEALEIRQAIGDRRGFAESLANIAGVLLQQGDPRGAVERFEAALALSREIGERNGEGLALINLGEVSLARAEPAKAAAHLNEAIKISREIGSKWLETVALFWLAETLSGGDRLGEADAHHRRAQQLREKLGAKAMLLESRLARAALALETGRPAVALAAARELVSAYGKADDANGEAEAEALVARSLLASGTGPEAATAAERASARVADSQNLLRRLRVRITALRVQGMTGDPLAARERLATIVAETAERGLTALTLEASLVLGEVELAAGDPAGKARLEALERDAERQGMLFVARKAREAIARRSSTSR